MLLSCRSHRGNRVYGSADLCVRKDDYTVKTKKKNRCKERRRRKVEDEKMVKTEREDREKLTLFVIILFTDV